MNAKPSAKKAYPSQTPPDKPKAPVKRRPAGKGAKPKGK